MNRRRFLRGVLAGSAVTVALPWLDLFLDGSGEARADGSTLPLVVGTCSWGCGINPARWVPLGQGEGWVPSVELQALAGLQDRVSVLSGFDVPLDGRSNFPHHTGMCGLRCGVLPEADLRIPGRSFDSTIAEVLGGATPFRSLELTATGRPSDSYSFLGADVTNPSEASPVALYERIFAGGVGSGGPFVPDPSLLLRKSALSAVMEDTARLQQRLGSHDRQRLDQYLTSVRQLERRLELLTSEPPDLAACSQPPPPEGGEPGVDIPSALATHEAMVDLLVMALSCDQTRVFNLMFSAGLSRLRQPGETVDHHQLTHDELIDNALGYQPRATEFVLASMTAWASLVRALSEVGEGDRTLLDRCMVIAHSETSLAKTHDISGIPVMIAGSANGALRPGVHLRGGGEPITRVGLTAMRLAGAEIARWGQGSLEATRDLDELLA